MPSPKPLSPRDAIAPAAARARERALAEQERLREIRASVKETVRPVVSHRPVRLLRSTFAQAWRDRVLGLSAEAAFWQLLSIPPLFLALLGTLGYFGDFLGANVIQTIEDNLIRWSEKVLTPSVVDSLVRPTVEDVLRRGRADVISIGFVMALWAGSSATATYVNTISIAYGMRDLRGAVRSRLVALAIYLIYICGGVCLVPIMVLGPSKIVNLMPKSIRGDAHTFVNALYWPVVAVLLLAGLTSLYHFALPKRLPWHRGVPGAAFAGCIFLLGSYAVRKYFGFVSHHAYAYGALGAPIAALLFLFLLALAILLGAELNAEIEQMWPSRPTRRARKKAAATQEADRLAAHAATKAAARSAAPESGPALVPEPEPEQARQPRCDPVNGRLTDRVPYPVPGQSPPRGNDS